MFVYSFNGLDQNVANSLKFSQIRQIIEPLMQLILALMTCSVAVELMSDDHDVQ